MSSKPTKPDATTRGARGRLVCLHGGGIRHRDYSVQHVGASHDTPAGYVARVACALGDHYLAPDAHDATRVVELTVHERTLDELYRWPNATRALEAIEQLATQKTQSE